MHKKNLAFVASCLFFTHFLHAQFAKGAYSINGNANLTATYTATKKDGQAYSLYLYPILSKLVTDHLELGGTVFASNTTYKGEGIYTYNSRSLGLNVFGKYYFNPKAAYKFYTAAQSGIGLSSYKFDIVPKRTSKAINFNLGVGVLKMINNDIALDARLDYDYSHNWSKLSNTNTNRGYSSGQLYLGFRSCFKTLN